MSNPRSGDLVLLVNPERKQYLIRLQAGQRWFSHHGWITHDELIDQPLGRTIHTSNGQAMLVLEPSTDDMIQELPRTTQIIYGKDTAQILLRLNLFPGRTVVEAGTGSGGLTLALARAVMPTGHVYTYETRADTFALAQRNMDEVGLSAHVTLYNEDVSGGFRQTEADACFLDMREPWRCLDQAWAALKSSGFFGALVPTTNQVSELVAGLQARAFGKVVIEEVLVRRYKPTPERLRPEDRMIAHSGFLIFARKLAFGDESLHWLPDEKKRRAYLGRLAMAEHERQQRIATQAEADAQADAADL